MSRRRGVVFGVGWLTAFAVLWVGQQALEGRAAREQVQAPRFEVDPFWPKPLPDNWRLGSAIGVWVDDQDLVWMVHRSSATLHNNERALELDPPQGDCCRGAPPILAFDQEGNLVHAWGGEPGEDYQGYEWPMSNHGIFVDHMGYVWLGANGGPDSQILKLTRGGDVVAQFGTSGQAMSSLSEDNFGRVAKVFVDAETNEVYAADGYLNRRVAVLDGETGEMLRFWGAYGNVPDDDYEYGPQGQDDRTPPQQFRNPVHCADLSHDGLVYVCDRQANRIQVFTRDGTFVEEAFFAPHTLRSGSTWDLAFSRDPEQRYLFIADGVNEKVRIVLRETLEELTNFGAGGRQPGQFYGVHSIATDSQGNIYTTETYEGKRLQRFIHMGTGPVPAGEQGVVWPGN